MNNKEILSSLKRLVSSPNLASKRWISEQYDSQVMNDTIEIGGNAAIIRVHKTNKALALTTDCTPRYVKADPAQGGKQAVAETYRNICAVGGEPKAITNCLNFGNPEKPEIMGQIVRAIDGINQACKELDYPVVSGNVSLYNETDGKAILPTPAIGGVGLLKNLEERCNHKLKNIGNKIYLLGKISGHLDCTIFAKEILGKKEYKNAPQVNLPLEKKHGKAVRTLINDKIINSCHDISDGGLLVALFEMCSKDLGVKISDKFLEENSQIHRENLFFGEDQGLYIVEISADNTNFFEHLMQDLHIEYSKIGKVIPQEISLGEEKISISTLQKINEETFPQNFS